MKVQVRAAGSRGRGVFAMIPFSTGQHIEEAPVIVYPAAQKEVMYQTVFADYPYDWVDGGEALAMGCGSFYNHSYKPNAIYRKNFEGRTINYFALRDIAAGEEITVNYNGVPEDPSPLWFEVEAESP